MNPSITRLISRVFFPLGVLFGLVAEVQAQEDVGFEANGPDVPPLTGGAVLLWSPSGMEKGEVRFGALGEVGTGLLQRYVGERDPVTVVPVVAGLNFSAGFAPLSRVGFGVSAAVWPLTGRGPGLSNVRFDVPVRLVMGDGPQLAVHPWGSLPAGTPARGSANVGPEAGLILAAGTGPGPVQAAANVGVSARRSVELGLQRVGGPSADFGASIGIGSKLRVDAEMRGAWSFRAGQLDNEGEIPDSNVFAEALVTGGGPLVKNLGWKAGAGTGLTQGVGSPVFRGFLGVVWKRAPEVVLVVEDPPQDPDPSIAESSYDGLVPLVVVNTAGEALPATVVATGVDGTRIEADVNDLKLAPGTWVLAFSLEGYGTQARSLTMRDVPPPPIEVVLQESVGGAELVHTVVDTQGKPVAGAVILIDGIPVGTTGSDGVVSIAGLGEGEHELSIEHPDFTASAVTIEMAAGTATVGTQLERAPGAVQVTVRTAEGDPVSDGVVRFTGPRRLPPMPLGEDGVREEVLGPGVWQVLVSSPIHGYQERELIITEGSSSRIVVDIVLHPDEGGSGVLDIRVVDPEGHPLDGVEVELDGQSFGLSSSGGALRLTGLLTGPREIGAFSPQHTAFDPVTISLHDGLQDQLITLLWKPGTVRVSAQTSTGPVADGRVEFDGPQELREELGADGRGLFEIGGGEWSSVVVSPEHGFAERSLSIDPESGLLYEIDVLLGSEDGLASLALEVSDPDGGPIHGAFVRLDGLQMGRTHAGALVLEGLSTGRRSLEVEAPFFEMHVGSVQMMEGTRQEEVVLQWAAGAVRVDVRGGDQAPVTDAVVTILGVSDRAPVPVNADGQRLFDLTEGDWQALVVSPTLGLMEVPFRVTEGDGLLVVPVTLTPVGSGEARLVLRVVDTLGEPVVGAKVFVDGIEVGTTPAGGVFRVEDRGPGPVQVEAEAEGYLSVSSDLDLPEGSQVRYLRLEALPGRLTVSAVDGAGRPVDAEVTLVGPNDWLPTPLGSDGKETFVVDPGRWQVVAQAPGLGAGRGIAQIGPDGDAELSFRLVTGKVEVTASGVEINDTVLFDFNEASLRPESDALLDEVANTLVGRPFSTRVEVQGHSDSIGDVAVNLSLSQRRAKSVLVALVARGVPPELLRARGFGSQRPVADNATEDGRAKNRRVTFEIGAD